METKQMIEVMQAFENGKKIEFRHRGKVPGDDWLPSKNPQWDWDYHEYRIAPEPEPKKEGRWERVEIFAAAGQYRLSVGGFIDYCPRVPGFGGIDYRSPFDERITQRSMSPVLFGADGMTKISACIHESDRPGIPVAAWFWKE